MFPKHKQTGASGKSAPVLLTTLTLRGILYQQRTLGREKALVHRVFLVIVINYSKCFLRLVPWSQEYHYLDLFEEEK